MVEKQNVPEFKFKEELTEKYSNKKVKSFPV